MYTQFLREEHITSDALQRLVGKANDHARTYPVSKIEEINQPLNTPLIGFVAHPFIQFTIARLMLENIAGRSLVAQVGVLIPLFEAQIQEDLYMIIEYFTNFGDRFANQSGCLGNLASLKKHHINVIGSDLPGNF